MSPVLRSAGRLLGDRVFLAVTALAVGCGALLYYIRGPAAIVQSLDRNLELFGILLIFLPAVLLLSSLVQVLIPRDRVVRWLGSESGLRGIVIASVGGALTPGGPFVTFPLVLALHKAGAAFGPMVAYVTAWNVISMTRLLIFDLPIIGPELGILRYAISLPLPIIAGLAANYLSRIYRPPAGGAGA